MNRILILLFIIISVSFSNCKKDELKPRESSNPCLFDCEDEFLLDVVWSKPINGLNDNQSHLQPFIYQNSIVFGAMKGSLLNEVIYSFNKEDGTKNWQWEDYYTSGPNFIEKIGTYENYGSISNSYRDYVINLDNGTTHWKYETPIGILSTPRAKLIGDWIYHPQEMENSYDDTIAYMTRTKIQNVNWEVVYTMRRDSDSTGVNMEPPSLAFNAKGDSILVFQRRSYNFSKYYNRQDLIAYNLNTRKVEWRFDFIDSPNPSSTHPVLIKNNIVIYLGYGKIFGINLNTAEILWTYTVPRPDFNSLAGASAIISGNYVIIKTLGDLIFTINIFSGSILWSKEINSTGGLFSNVTVYKNKLYFISPQKLFCLNASTGELIYKYRSPNAFKTENNAEFSGSGGLAIDPSSNRMYFTDSYYINCIQLSD